MNGHSQYYFYYHSLQLNLQMHTYALDFIFIDVLCRSTAPMTQNWKKRSYKAKLCKENMKSRRLIHARTHKSWLVCLKVNFCTTCGNTNLNHFMLGAPQFYPATLSIIIYILEKNAILLSCYVILHRMFSVFRTHRLKGVRIVIEHFFVNQKVLI